MLFDSLGWLRRPVCAPRAGEQLWAAEAVASSSTFTRSCSVSCFGSDVSLSFYGVSGSEASSAFFFLLLLYISCSGFRLDIRSRNSRKGVTISRPPKAQGGSTVRARGDEDF